MVVRKMFFPCKSMIVTVSYNEARAKESNGGNSLTNGYFFIKVLCRVFSCVHLRSIFCANVSLWKRWNLTNQTELNLAEIMWRWQKSYIVSTSQWKTRGCLTPQNKIMNELSLFSADNWEPLLTCGPEWIMCLIKGAAVLEVDTMISSCKNHKKWSKTRTLTLFSAPEFSLDPTKRQSLGGTRVGCHYLLHLLEDEYT